MTSLLPLGEQTFFSSAGVPLAGGSVAFYTPGTTTQKATWQDAASLALNTNPVVLDSGGRAIVYGSGQYRMIVTDSAGNLQYDQLTASADFGISLTSLGASTPMLPVLQAASLKVAANLLQSQGDHLNILTGDQLLTVSPTANAITTLSSLNVQGKSTTNASREFLANLGFEVATGSGGVTGTGTKDKVTLYSGLNAKAGAGDIWTLNTCLTMAAGTGAVNAQGYELDFNNFNAHRGNSGNLTADFTAPICNGLTITGASGFSSSVGLAIEGASSLGSQWNRGIALVGPIGLCCIQDWANAPVGIQFDSAHTIAHINFTSLYGNAGAVGNVANSTNTAMFMKNNMNVSWQTANLLGVVTDTVDINNNRLIGVGAATVTSSVEIDAPTFRLPSANATGPGALTWPKVGGAGGNFIQDYSDTTNGRFVGVNSSGVICGSQIVPQISGFNVGNPTQFWGNIYLSGGIIAPSDVTLKTDVVLVPSMLDKITAVNPIKFVYKDSITTDEKLHYGFDARDIKNNFEANFAGYHQQDDGTGWLQKDELIAVLWKGVQELSARVIALEAK